MKKLLLLLFVILFGQGVIGQNYFGPNYVHQNHASNCSGDYTILDGTIIGTDMADHILFTHLYGPDYLHSTYMTKSHGLWYTGSEWSIFNETQAAIDTGLAFNVLNPKTNGTTFMHTVTLANSTGNWSDIDDPLLNGNSTAVFFISKTWENGVYDSAHVGIWYDSFNSKWAVYNEDAATPLKEGSTYNIFVPADGTSFYKHTANSPYYITELDNPLLNGNPDARIFVVHDYTNNSLTQGYINDEIGVWYSGAGWTIYNEDPSHPFFVGATFNVLIIRDFPVGIANNPPEPAKIKVTPNPAKEKIAVLLNTSSLKSLKEIRISSMDGQILIHKDYTGNQDNPIVFDLSSVAPGLYVLTAVTAEGTLSTKVNVVR
ncbi:MAG: T9SS type A sorting domain-containing protein [Bacteroidetes bacterium]|nr:T9SS type A sorting domain-containing protein [Bacteroidota bacterium]